MFSICLNFFWQPSLPNPGVPMPLLWAWTDRSPRPLSMDVPHLGSFRASSHSTHRPKPTQMRLFHPLAALQRQIWAHQRVPHAELVPERPSYDQTIAWFDKTTVWFDIWCAPAPLPSTEHISEINHSMVWTCPGPPTPAATPLDTTGHTHSPSSPIIHICALGHIICDHPHIGRLPSSIVPSPYSSYKGSRHWKCHLRHGGLLRRHLAIFSLVAHPGENF